MINSNAFTWVKINVFDSIFTEVYSDGLTDNNSALIQLMALHQTTVCYMKPWMWLVHIAQSTVASFTKELNLRLAQCPLKTNGRLAIRGLTTLVKEATGN